MANELLIKINADAKNAKKAFDDIRDQTTDLESNLKTAALVSGAAFAAFTAEIYLSVKAFEEAQQATVKLSNALQNQGIFTEELTKQYDDYAQAVQAATGIDDDALKTAQAVAQTYLGQTEVTKDLTFAIADLSASMGGDLNGAAQKIARTIGTSTNAFAKEGLVIREGATEAERFAQVLDFVNIKAGGLAAEMNKADGFSHALTTSFGNLQEKIGEKFAPAFAAARQALISLFDAISSNPALTQLIVTALAVGAAITGTVAFVSVAIPAFLALSAAATALGISLSVALVGIPVIIGAIVAAVTLLVLNWDKAMAALSAAATATVTLVTELFSGLGKVLQGAFNLDTAAIKAGLTQIKDSFGKAKDDAVGTYKEITAAQAEEGEKQNAKKKELADREAAIEKQHQQNLRDIRQGELDLLKLQNEHASEETIALKQREIETIKALDTADSAEKLALLQQRRAEIVQLQEEQNAEDLEREATFRQLQAEAKAEADALGIETSDTIRADQLAKIEATAMTEGDVDKKLQEDILRRRIEVNNQLLLDKKKYGENYALLNKKLNSDEINATKSAADSLVALSNSTNSTLKGIGKAAAITQIGIDTARGALAVYANFQTAIPYPPISVPLGLAAAAALVGYGAQKISEVRSAQDGGLVEGGVAGKDSVPFLLEPGELVVPRKNFNDVVGAVTGEKSSTGDERVVSLLESINQKFTNPQQTIIQGDVHNDDSYIDSLVRKISDAIEFRNAQIVGVTT